MAQSINPTCLGQERAAVGWLWFRHRISTELKQMHKLFFMLFLLKSMRKVVFCRRKMAAWQAKLDDSDKCCSCFSCIDTSLPLDNKGITWLFKGILFICAHVVSFARTHILHVVSFVALALCARAANDTTRAQINKAKWYQECEF